MTQTNLIKHIPKRNCYSELHDFFKRQPNEVKIDDILATFVVGLGYLKAEVAYAIGKLMRDGDIFETKKGHVQRLSK